MGEMKTENILGRPMSIPVTENADDMPITTYAPLPDIVKQAEEDFYQKMQEFLQHTLNDDGIVKAARAWERAGAVLAGYAGSLFNQDVNNVEQRKYALELYDKVSKGANLRQQNIRKYCNNKLQTLEEGEEKDKQTEKLDKIKFEVNNSLIRAINTYERFKDLYVKGGTYEISQMQNKIDDARKAEQIRSLLPRDRIHIPGRIYPPIPIPADQLVPEWPRPYREYKKAPVEAKEYNAELDEVVLKKDWVDPNGLVNADSIVWDREKGEVSMKLIGQEKPIVWKEWKATWTGDVMEDGSWPQEYYIRLGLQLRARQEFGLFEPQPYEEDAEIYRKN